MYVPVKLRHLYNGQRSVSFYHKLEGKAIKKRDIAERDMYEGRGQSRSVIFGPYLKRWLKTLETLGSVAERTLQDYRYWAERHLIPNLGTLPLDDLSAEEFDLLYVTLARRGMGARG